VNRGDSSSKWKIKASGQSQIELTNFLNPGLSAAKTRFLVSISRLVQQRRGNLQLANRGVTKDEARFDTRRTEDGEEAHSINLAFASAPCYALAKRVAPASMAEEVSFGARQQTDSCCTLPEECYS
jgi:hypothetical protein